MPQVLKIGRFTLRNPVALAPMAGVTDAPFRAAAWRLGAGMVAAEMAAGKELLAGRQLARLAAVDACRGDGDAATKDTESAADAEATVQPRVVQLAGHDPHMMARAAAVALEHDAQVIDINMGCPAKMVTGKLSGAALMRDPALAQEIITAVLEVAREAGAEVSVKMRLGWDEATRNAPQLALMAAGLGVALVTVHGRTRQQFYRGRADWQAVGQVVRTLRMHGHGIPVLVNGDIVDVRTARLALAQSGADGVMIGRAATGRPWLPGEIAAGLRRQETAAAAGGRCGVAPAPGAAAAAWLHPAQQVQQIRRLHADMVAFHGQPRGLRRARKHLKAALTHWQQEGWLHDAEARQAAKVLLRSDDLAAVQEELARLEELARKASVMNAMNAGISRAGAAMTAGVAC